VSASEGKARFDARCRPASVARLVFSLFGILFRRPECWRRSASTCRLASQCSPSLYSDYCVDVEMIGIAAFSVGLRTWCRTASRGSSLLSSESCVDVRIIGFAKLGVVFPVS
jgi:hypothetical protein